MSHKKAKGERVGAIPFGYDLADDGINLVPNDQEQGVIAEIRQLHAEGYSLRRIALCLTEQGIHTKEGNLRWSHQAVAKILDRKAA